MYGNEDLYNKILYSMPKNNSGAGVNKQMMGQGSKNPLKIVGLNSAPLKIMMGKK
jgi:hypothetical protein